MALINACAAPLAAVKARYMSRVVGVKCKSTAAYIVVREDTYDTQTTH